MAKLSTRKPTSPKVVLAPAVDVEGADEGTYQWRVAGSRPSFDVVIDHLETIEGWFRLRFDFSSDDPRRTAPILRTMHPIGGTSRALQIGGKGDARSGSGSIDKVFHVLGGTASMHIDVPLTTNGLTVQVSAA